MSKHYQYIDFDIVFRDIHLKPVARLSNKKEVFTANNILFNQATFKKLRDFIRDDIGTAIELVEEVSNTSSILRPKNYDDVVELIPEASCVEGGYVATVAYRIVGSNPNPIRLKTSSIVYKSKEKADKEAVKLCKNMSSSKQIAYIPKVSYIFDPVWRRNSHAPSVEVFIYGLLVDTITLDDEAYGIFVSLGGVCGYNPMMYTDERTAYLAANYMAKIIMRNAIDKQ